MNDWLKQFLENYEGRSEEARALESKVQTVGSGSTKYIPWATMEILALKQDPSMTVDVIRSEHNAGLITTDSSLIYVRQKTDKGETFTESKVFSHFVVLEATWLGKTMREYYPIQRVVRGEGYVAVAAYDQNDVNKAIQRGKAKLLSRLTGIGLALYESKDLQFEDDPVEETKPKFKTKSAEIKPITPAAEPTPVPLVQETKQEAPAADDKLMQYAKTIHKNDAINAKLQQFNTSLITKYQFSISIDDPVEDIAAKLAKIENPDIFYNALTK